MAAGFEISFIDTETARWLEKAPDDGLCLKRFRADYVVDNLRSFEEGKKIVIDGESYLIIKKGKRCFAECDLLKRLGGSCPLASGVAFGEKEKKMGKMKATVLVDNIKGCGLNGEWGLCVYIEYEDKVVLLDTGASELFVKNAKQLGLDLKKVDFGVLSHAHFDHADGMKAFFAVNERAPFYLQKDAKENCYEKFWIFSKYIGIPRGILEEDKERITFAEGKYQVCQGVWLLPHTTSGLEAIGKRNHMYLRTDVRENCRGSQKWRPDDFSHEQSLVFETEDGLVIFNSCSHGGADNIINEVKEAFPGEKIKAIIGGFHLYTRKADEVRELARSIRDTGIQQVYTGHCTGDKAFDVLKDELGEMVHQLSCGLVIEF